MPRGGERKALEEAVEEWHEQKWLRAAPRAGGSDFDAERCQVALPRAESRVMSPMSVLLSSISLQSHHEPRASARRGWQGPASAQGASLPERRWS